MSYKPTPGLMPFAIFINNLERSKADQWQSLWIIPSYEHGWGWTTEWDFTVLIFICHFIYQYKSHMKWH